eukprot:TRINITY_DN1181_c0_g1_i2.p1 TRINITY_DN1181_c0_g1~~TRINITY_DN1181_c0_g1_i2.p1  ORF type:complete len:1112 (-),score=340.77 TRINITY_DN1181_c0_g1_i2:62-3397(-)
MNVVDRSSPEVLTENSLLTQLQLNPSLMQHMRMVRLYPGRDSYAELGRALCRLGKFAYAQHFLRKALDYSQNSKVDAEDLKLALDLAKCSVKLGDSETALDYCNSGVKILAKFKAHWKDNFDIEGLLGEFNELIRPLEGSKKQTTKAKKPTAMTCEALMQRGKEHMKTGKYVEAIKDLEAASELFKKTKNTTETLRISIAKYKAVCVRKMRDKENSQSATKASAHMRSLISSTVPSKMSNIASSMKEFPKVQVSDKRDAAKIEQEKIEAIRLLNTFAGKYREFANLRRWHIVSMRWFEKWKVYMRLAKAKNERSVSSASKAHVLSPHLGPARKYPGPIANTELICDLTGVLSDPAVKEYPVKSELKENVDFIVIPDKLWTLWEGIYGGCDIARISHPGKEGMRLDLHMQKLEVALLPRVEEWVPCTVQTIYADRYTAPKAFIEKCERIVRELTKSWGEAEIRVWKTNETAEEICRKFACDFSAAKAEVAGKILESNEMLIEDNNKQLILVELAIPGRGFIAKPLIFKAIPRARGDFSFARTPFEEILPEHASRGIAGIENITNSCYMNSGIQCLSYCSELTKYFLLGLHKGDFGENKSAEKKGLAQAYANIICELWKEPQSAVTTRELKLQLSRRAEQFYGFTQEDSGEFVVFLMDGLHEALNRARPGMSATIKEDDEEEQWKQYWERNDSIIMELFLGQMKTQIACPKCDFTSNKFEPFLTLSVPIPSFNYITVVFIPTVQNGEEAAARKMMKVEGNMTMKSIKPTADKKYLYALVKNGQITHRIPENISLLKVAEVAEEVYAFEYDCEDESQGYHLVEIQVAQSDKNRVYYARRPLVFCAAAEWSLDMFKLRLFKKLLPLLQSSSPQESDVEKDYSYGKVPYQLHIVPGPEGCEFCDTPHTDNCEFSFKDEDRITVADVIQALRTQKSLVLSLLLKDAARSLFKQLNTVAEDAIQRKRISIYDCLDAFSKEEELDKDNMWECNKCREKVQALKKLNISKAPPILIVQLNRFVHEDVYSATRKVESFVDYPIEGFSLERYVSGKEKVLYNLFGVTNHFGAAGDGHYTAFCKSEIKKMWIEFDDKRLSGIKEEDVVSKFGYVLYYRRKDLC